MSTYILPILIIILIVYACYKKVNVYQAFTSGAKGSLSLVSGIFPYIVGIMVAVTLFRVSGLASLLAQLLSPIFGFLGIPAEVCELVLLRPFTGSGSLSLLENVLSTYGADSYISRCACTILASSETVFYVSAVYFAGTKSKKVWVAITIALVCNIVGAILSCLLCKLM